MLDYQTVAIEFDQEPAIDSEDVNYILPCIRMFHKRCYSAANLVAVRACFSILELSAFLAAPGWLRPASRADIRIGQGVISCTTRLAGDSEALQDSAVLETAQLLSWLQVDQHRLGLCGDADLSIGSDLLSQVSGHR